MSKFVLFLFIFPIASFAQEKQIISLQEAILLAQENSIDALEARQELHTSITRYRNFKTTFLPQIVLNGTLPSLNKSNSKYQNDDGSYKFISTSVLSENLSFSIQQQLPWTGGTISIQSSIDNMEQIGDAQTRQFSSVPISLSLSQPIFAYNEYKWNKQLEPLLLQYARKQYQIKLEEISIKTITYYFELLLAQVNEEIARQQFENSKKLLQIAEGKKERGLIDNNEFQQLKLNYINSSASIIESAQDVERKRFQLCSFFNIKENIQFITILPDNTPHVDISLEQVLKIVENNHPFKEEINQRLIMIEQNLAQAKAQRRPSINTYFSIGYSATGNSLQSAYKDLQNRQLIEVNVKLPILDWGKAKRQVEIAKEQKGLEEKKIKNDIRNLKQNVKILVNNIQNQNRLLQTYKFADTIAQNRYRIAYETFIMGRISVLDLNNAQIEKDNAQRNYINQMYSSWILFYQLRQLALYDFIENKDLITPKNNSRWTRKSLLK